MRTKKIIKNFQCRLDYVCGNNDLRPVFKNLYFKDGFVYGTDAHLMLRHSLDVHGFTEDEIKLMDGKMISSTLFKEIYKYHVVHAEEDGFMCHIDGGSTKFFYDSSGVKFPDCERLFKEYLEMNVYDNAPFGVSINLISKFKHLFHYPDAYERGIELFVKQSNKGILVTPTSNEFLYQEQLAVIMPIMLKSKFKS